MQLQGICQGRSTPKATNTASGALNRLRRDPTLAWCTLTLMRLVLVFSFLLVLPLLLCAGPQAAAPVSEDYSGMYSFLKEGEFVQVTIEDKGVVTGFISRFGDSESDRGTFLNQFFKTGKCEGSKLSFTTESVHGVWYTFEGTFDRGPGKKPDEEAYYLLRGALTRFSTDAEKKTRSEITQVEFKSFPRDTTPPQ
jgi:hypothetical protein